MTELTPKQQAVFDAFKKNGKSKPHNIAIKMGFTESTHIYVQIKSLCKKGLMRRCDGEGLKYVHYEIIQSP